MRKTILACGAAAVVLSGAGELRADVLCKVKKTGAVIARATTCTKKETAIATLATSATSTSTAAGLTVGSSVSVQDTGAVASGADSTIGVDLSVNRLNATGGVINTTGMSLSVVGDAGGDSTNTGLSVQTSGADNNYSAVFQGGNVGIGVSDPDEALEIAGRLHLGEVAAPSETSGRLYNLAGNLYWNGQQVGLDSSGALTGVTAGSGLAGGGTSGNITLSVDTGTSAGKIVQLNGSSELPAVSGANLTSLNASSLSSGTVSAARLPGSVSLLGTSIGLSTEVSGVLPIANGGTGAASLSDLLALGTNTTGNYVATVAGGTGISVSPSSGSEGSAVTVSLDTSATPTWAGVHSFSSGINIGTLASSSEVLHIDGRLHLEPGSAPGVTTNKLYNTGGDLFFNGVNISQQAAGGDITGVTAGTGLTGGGTTGAVTLAVDVGTTANDIVQLNSSAQLPAVSGVNLTALNASNLTTGTVSNSRLAGEVSLLGSSISLTSEVTGTLPLANGGIGATSLNDLITLGTHTTGGYVSSIASGTGITLGTTGTEGIAATLSLDQAVAPIWTGQHTFSGVSTDITTGTNQDFAIVPNGTGKIGLGTNSPVAFLDSAFSTASGTAGSQSGASFSFADTGVVSTGTDTTIGLDVELTRTGATGGTIDSRGLQVTVTGDTGGAASTKVTGLDVSVGGADTNYSALFNGGRVGIGTSTPSAILDTVFASASATAATEVGNELNVTDSGSVASGTDSTIGLDLNVARSSASGGTIATTGLDISVTDDGGGTSTATALRASATGGDTNYAAIFPSGFVGIGTSTPQNTFDLDLASASATADVRLGASFSYQSTGVVTTGTDQLTTVEISSARSGATGGDVSNTGLVVTAVGQTGTAATTLATGLDVSASGADANLAAIFRAGSVAIGSSGGIAADSDIPSGSLVIGAGALCVDDNSLDCQSASRTAGNIYAEGTSITGIDLAEEFPIREGDSVEAGDIVVADTSKAQRCAERGKGADGNLACARYEWGFVPFVTKSKGKSAENKRVLGIVSTDPGITLGGFRRDELIGYKRVPLALAGRVPVKVNSENGAIEVGDRITPSSVPGVGKRAEEGDVVVGIALEPLEGESGAVVALVTLR